jgi:hypothetical protein
MQERNKIRYLLVFYAEVRNPARLAAAKGDNVMRKKAAIAVVALLAGALTLPNHEAWARDMQLINGGVAGVVGN